MFDPLEFMRHIPVPHPFGAASGCANRHSCRFGIARLAALVPRPRAHLTRYHGVFAPNFNRRDYIVHAHHRASSHSERNRASSRSERNRRALPEPNYSWPRHHSSFPDSALLLGAANAVPRLSRPPSHTCLAIVLARGQPLQAPKYITMTAKCLLSVQSRTDLFPYRYPSGNPDQSVDSLIVPELG